MKSPNGLSFTTAVVVLALGAGLPAATAQTSGCPAGTIQSPQSTQPMMMFPHTTGEDMGQGMLRTAADDRDMPRMRMHRHMLRIIFAILDTNGDGAVSFEELTAAERRIFDLIDTNKDGKITPEELEAFMQE
jgi:EF hand